MADLMFCLGPTLMGLPLFVLAAVVFYVSARRIERRMPTLALVCLVVGIIGASLASLAQGRFLPHSGGLFIGFSAPDRVHRGWPLPWLGLRGVETVILPLALAVDTLVWTVVTCVLAYLVSLAAEKLKYKVFQEFAFFLMAAAVIAAGYFVPFLIPAVD